MPGETSQESGRAYVFVFGGCLERAIKGFKQVFDVYSSPEKLEFTGFTGAPYSFDLSGVYEGAEVFIESKGYQDGGGLLESYKEFLAKAYCTTVQISRHRRDRFWFVTNVPFGSSVGRKLWDWQFVGEALRDRKSPGLANLLGNITVDDNHVRSLASRIAVGIFTDSFIKLMGTLYRFRPGDTLWSVTKLIHGGRIPTAQFEPIITRVRQMNNIPDPNRIRSGQQVNMPWLGISGD
jgi:hypothetical protein